VDQQRDLERRCRRGCRHGRAGICTPIFRRWRHAPKIPGRFQPNADQPILAARRGSKVACHLRISASPTGKSFHSDSQSRLQWLGKADSTASRVDQDGVAILGKRNRRIYAGDADGNLRSHPRAETALYQSCQVTGSNSDFIALSANLFLAPRPVHNQSNEVFRPRMNLRALCR
jgi:hypothetical protein